MNVQATGPFDRLYAALPARIKDRVDKQISLLLSNPRHPSLQLKRIRGTEDIWEIRVTRGYRITLQIVAEIYLLRRVGTHDVLREP